MKRAMVGLMLFMVAIALRATEEGAFDGALVLISSMGFVGTVVGTVLALRYER